MAQLTIRKATRSQAKLRLGLLGPAGSGKTYTALKISKVLAQGKPVLFFDTEHGSAEKYANYEDPEVGKLEFDVITPDTFSPEIYIEAIRLAEENGYGVVVLDSLSHAWMGKDGALELVDKAQARQRTPNSYTAWRDVTPLHNAMIDAIVGAKIHVIATMRTKMDYIQEKDSQGKTIIRKVGMQPVQRDGMEYEFDVIGDLDQDNALVIGKTRCPMLSGGVFKKPGKAIAATLLQWLSEGTPAPDSPKAEPKTVTTNADKLGRHDEEASFVAEDNKAKALSPDAALRLRNQINENKTTTDRNVVARWYEDACAMARVRRLDADLDDNASPKNVAAAKQAALNLVLACIRHDEEVMLQPA